LAVVGGERGAQDPRVLSQHLRVAAAELFEQPSRPFDVREQEGDGAAVKLRHKPPLNQAPTSTTYCQATPRYDGVAFAYWNADAEVERRLDVNCGVVTDGDTRSATRSGLA